MFFLAVSIFSILLSFIERSQADFSSTLASIEIENETQLNEHRALSEDHISAIWSLHRRLDDAQVFFKVVY